jgi:hypothetical protein
MAPRLQIIPYTSNAVRRTKYSERSIIPGSCLGAPLLCPPRHGAHNVVPYRCLRIAFASSLNGSRISSSDLLTGGSQVRVLHGELFRFANYSPTHGLAESAESFPLSAFVVFRNIFGGFRGSPTRREFSARCARARRRPLPAPNLSKTLALSG